MFSCGILFHFLSEITSLRAKISVCAKHPNPVNFNIMQGVSARWEIISIGCIGSASPVQENFSILGHLCHLGGITISCKGRTQQFPLSEVCIQRRFSKWFWQLTHISILSDLFSKRVRYIKRGKQYSSCCSAHNQDSASADPL